MLNDAAAAAGSLAFTVVISTYNRSELLAATLRSVLAQETGGRIAYEVIVVDNNSRDDTRDVVERIQVTASVRVRYLFEGRQGVAYARNAGIHESRGAIVAFVDDDVIVPPDWLTVLDATLAERRDVSFVGGKVLPLWDCEPPRWLTRAHWSPLGLLDHGDKPFRVSTRRPYCLLSGNLGVRREVFDRVGVFDPEFQRVEDGIGSTEDHEFEMRVWRAGGFGLYQPTLVAKSPVPSSRMTKTYHRRWHKGHGAFSAMMWPYTVPTDVPTLYGLPAYYYRVLIDEAINVVRATLRRDPGAAFLSEAALWHASSYVRKLRAIHRSDRSSAATEFFVFCLRLMRSKVSAALAGRH